MKPISEEQLQNRLSSGSKRRLKAFRSNLLTDRDVRNFDAKLDAEVLKYLRDDIPNDYEETKEYLRTLRSSKDGKLFSQGVKSYAQLQDALGRFLEDNHPSFQWNKNYQSAKSELIREFSALKLKMLQYHDDESMIEALPKDDTHSGFTYILTGYKKKRENLGNIYSAYSLEEEEARRCGSFNKPILPGVRTQGSGAFTDDGERTGDCKHKTRMISMIDMYVIFAELKFAKPIQRALALKKWYAGGKDPHEISTIILNMRKQHDYWVSLDYSAFDQSISDWLIRDVFEIISSAFVDCDEELLSIIVEDFINKNFVFGDGVYYACKGVPSGSMFTQIVDSIANVLMVQTYLKSIGVKGSMIVMGDDNLLYTKGPVSSKLISTYLNKNFGTNVNPDKTVYAPTMTDPTFLSRVWKWNGQYRETHTVISKMLYPERWRDYKSGIVDATLVLYAYILTYPITMGLLIDIYKFRRENPRLNVEYVLNEVDSRYLPGALSYIREYTRFRDTA